MYFIFSILVGGSTKNFWGFEHFFHNTVQEWVIILFWVDVPDNNIHIPRMMQLFSCHPQT